MDSSKRSTLFISIFLLLLLSSFSFAYCPTAKRNIYLAAVTGENSGGVFQLEVEVRPGTGQIYTSISPRIGLATQESESLAVNWAFAQTSLNRRECDVLFRIIGDFGENTVDGPSAGGAMTVATHAALAGKQIRQDVVMTGTIAPGGKVGEVGGIIEKSIAASDSGAKYFLAPKLKVYEAFLIASVGRDDDFTAIEIANVSDAEEILFSGYSENFSSRFSPKSAPVSPSLPALPGDADMLRFGNVARDVVDDLDEKVVIAFFGAEDNERTSALREYFAGEIANYRKLVSMGYPFTSANAAFLLSIDAEYVKIGDKSVDLEGSIEDVSACVQSIRKPEKNSNNLGWAAGADLRRIWAGKKLDETLDYRSEQGGYTTLRDLLFSYGWCGISQRLSAEASTIQGEPLDESRLSSLASERLIEAQEVLAAATSPDYDAIWHYEAGLAANKTGYFAAAIYEAAYAETMQKATSGEEKNVSAAIAKLAEGGRKSLWGKIYYSHGMFLYNDALENGKPPNDAYKILKFSSELDKADLDMQKELSKPVETVRVVSVEKPPEKQGPTEQDPLVAIFLALSIVVFGLAIIYRLMRRARGQGAGGQ